MPLRSVTEFTAFLESQADSSRAERLLELSWSLKATVPRANFSPREVWSNAVVPSALGETVLDRALSARPELGRAELAFGLLACGCFGEPLIDFDRSDVKALLDEVDTCSRSGELNWPIGWGRTLYERFFELAEDSETDALSPERTLMLLNDTPQGLYQYGQLVLGPLGLTVVNEIRHIPCGAKFPLWHCSDTGCMAVHSVQLQVPEVAAMKAMWAIAKEARSIAGSDQPWTYGFAMAQRRRRWKHYRRFVDLPTLLYEGLTAEELGHVGCLLLDGTSAGTLRDALRKSPATEPLAKSASNAIVSGLSAEALVQLLMTCEDRVLVNALDAWAHAGGLQSARHGVRRTMTGAYKLRMTDGLCELSRLGIRAATAEPSALLVRRIFDAYCALGRLNDLGWKVSQSDVPAEHSDVMQYVLERGPRDAIEHLVLSEMGVTRHVSNASWLDLTALGKAETAVDRLLWKTGFPVLDMEAPQDFAARNLEALRERAAACVGYVSESDREELRGAGVNAFVGVENDLQRFLAWNVWLLGTDHFVDSRGEYREREAFARVSEILGERVESGGVVHRWSSEGKNTLGCVLAYLVNASAWWTSLTKKSKADAARTNDDLPHYDGNPDVIFPFRHKQLWADCNNDQLGAYVASLNECASEILRQDAAGVRNGLDHFRKADEFPDPRRIGMCAGGLCETLRRAYAGGQMPKPWYVVEVRHDYYNHRTWTLEDARSERMELHGPTQVAGLVALEWGVPYLVVRQNLLALPNATLRFRYTDVGPHERFWAVYPRRREIPRKGSVEQPAGDVPGVGLADS